METWLNYFTEQICLRCEVVIIRHPPEAGKQLLPVLASWTRLCSDIYLKWNIFQIYFFFFDLITINDWLTNWFVFIDHRNVFFSHFDG